MLKSVKQKKTMRISSCLEEKLVAKHSESMRKNMPNGLKNSKAAAKISLDFAIQDKVAQAVKNHNCNWMMRSHLSWHFLKRITAIFLILWQRATIRIAIAILSMLVAEISKHKLTFYRSRKETISNLKVKRAIIIF